MGTVECQGYRLKEAGQNLNRGMRRFRLKISATIINVSKILECNQSTVNQAAINLLNGSLVAFPTETVYGLGADALNRNAISRIYAVKDRPKDHPLIVHISSISYLDRWSRDIPDYATKLAENLWPGPMTLILPRTDIAKDFITGGQDCVGLRVPDQQFALLLLSEFEKQGGMGVAAPSANRFGKVSPTSAQDVYEELNQYLGIEDLILDGGKCQVGLESTIIDCRLQRPKILRPGVITKTMIEDISGLEIISNGLNDQVKASGLLKSHYAPAAEVFLTDNPDKGDGFIALIDIETPKGAIRLASPKDSIQYAQVLYQALRLADRMQIKKIFVIPPLGDEIATAIQDRLIKAAKK